MKTDQAIYEFLATGPEAFRVLTAGLTLAGNYAFRSLTFKALERRADGVYEPVGHDGPAYLIEFQGQPVAHAWYNLLTKMGLYGEAHPHADVRGILIFLDERDDPHLPTGIGAADPPFKAVYLDRFLPDWLEREPDNPFVAVFAPLVLKRDEDLRALAPRLWRTIQDAPLPEPVRQTLSQVLEFWLFERFRTLTAEEIWTMLHHLTPLEETRAYQSIFVKGEAKGKAEGKAEGIKRLLVRRFGPLPPWAEERIASAPTAQLDAWLDALLDADSVAALIGPEPT
jgi:predicted transposase YdaD